MNFCFKIRRTDSGTRGTTLPDAFTSATYSRCRFSRRNQSVCDRRIPEKRWILARYERLPVSTGTTILAWWGAKPM